MKTNIVKQLTVEALFEMLEVMSLEEISVTSLSRKAGIARASFYRNFTDIDDVINYFIQQMFLDITEEGTMAESKLDAFIELIFTNTRMYRKELFLLDKNHKLQNVADYLYTFTYQEIQRIISEENDYIVYYFAGAATSFHTGWIHNGCKESPEEITKIFVHCIKGDYLPSSLLSQ